MKNHFSVTSSLFAEISTTRVTSSFHFFFFGSLCISFRSVNHSKLGKSLRIGNRWLWTQHGWNPFSVYAQHSYWLFIFSAVLHAINYYDTLPEARLQKITLDNFHFIFVLLLSICWKSAETNCDTLNGCWNETNMPKKQLHKLVQTFVFINLQRKNEPWQSCYWVIKSQSHYLCGYSFSHLEIS